MKVASLAVWNVSRPSRGNLGFEMPEVRTILFWIQLSAGNGVANWTVFKIKIMGITCQCGVASSVGSLLRACNVYHYIQSLPQLSSSCNSLPVVPCTASFLIFLIPCGRFTHSAVIFHILSIWLFLSYPLRLTCIVFPHSSLNYLHLLLGPLGFPDFAFSQQLSLSSLQWLLPLSL